MKKLNNTGGLEQRMKEMNWEIVFAGVPSIEELKNNPEKYVGIAKGDVNSYFIPENTTINTDSLKESLEKVYSKLNIVTG